MKLSAVRPWLFLSATVMAASVLPANAKPSSTSVGRVERCADATCGAATGVSPGSVLTGTIRMEAKAQSGLVGLDSVKLEILPPDKANDAGNEFSWVCIEQWYGDARQSFAESYVWNTAIWPDPPKNSQCPDGSTTHFHDGKPTLNGTYKLRVQARDIQDENNPTVSSTFEIRLANVPSTPSWATQPSASEGPVVSLRWAPNKETDVTEYRFVRVDPKGQAAAFAIDAKNPAKQGCSKVEGLYYSCADRGFAGASSGTYRYALVALRPAPGATRRCALSGAPCAESALSAPREVEVTVPAAVAASPTPSASASAAPSGQPPAPGSAAAAPSALPEAEAERHEQALRSGRRLPLPLSVVAGLLVLGVAAVILRMLWKGRIAAAAKR